MMSSGKTRHIYYAGPVPMIDVFFDKLDYCHEVLYKDRLELDPYSVTLADIMLQKLQIWEINDKDLKDIEYLFDRPPRSATTTHKKINQTYIARRFADDWGFWYTATTNFGRVKEHVDNVAGLHRRAAPAHQGPLRPVPGAHRGRAQDQGLEQARQEGHEQALVQHRLLRLVSHGAAAAGRPRPPRVEGGRLPYGSRPPLVFRWSWERPSGRRARRRSPCRAPPRGRARAGRAPRRAARARSPPAVRGAASWRCSRCRRRARPCRTGPTRSRSRSRGS